MVCTIMLDVQQQERAAIAMAMLQIHHEYDSVAANNC